MPVFVIGLLCLFFLCIIFYYSNTFSNITSFSDVLLGIAFCVIELLYCKHRHMCMWLPASAFYERSLHCCLSLKSISLQRSAHNTSLLCGIRSECVTKHKGVSVRIEPFLFSLQTTRGLINWKIRFVLYQLCHLLSLATGRCLACVGCTLSTLRSMFCVA